MIMGKEKIKIEVIRSARRRKTVSARLENNKLVVRIPATLSRKKEKEIVGEMKEKLLAKRELDELNREKNLLKKARELNRKYFDGKLKIKSVRFVANQNKQFGSCTVSRGTIRISDRLAKAPGWVLSYVMMHELSHLQHPNHSKKFWDCVYRYPYTERARGYLIALSLEKDEIENRP